MIESYETYCAMMHAQDVTPLTRAAWDRENELAKPHTVDFTVTPEMAEHGTLAVGNYRNHFGANQRFIRTERL